jgi:hypothetical protein
MKKARRRTREEEGWVVEDAEKKEGCVRCGRKNTG